jgi:hypothetical protein
MKTKVALLFLILLMCSQITAQETPRLADVDRVRLAEAFRIGEALGNRIWRNWNAAPFAVLLVTQQNEFLIRHPQPSDDFTRLGYDSLLRSDVYFRPRRTGRIDLLATYPAIRGSAVSTIVVGQAENTSARTSVPWVVTLLHEHFHQLQSSQPDYYPEVERLNLSRGDQTGMWMLNFPFPYSSNEVGQQFSALSRMLLETIQAQGQTEFSTRLRSYLDARRRFRETLGEDDYKYFSFQVWQEGMARYTEYQIARLASNQYRPSRRFRALRDFTSFGDVADSIQTGIFNELRSQSIGRAERLVFYPFGAAEGLLLDRANPGWRNHYFSEKFFIERYFNNTE